MSDPVIQSIVGGMVTITAGVLAYATTRINGIAKKVEAVDEKTERIREKTRVVKDTVTRIEVLADGNLSRITLQLEAANRHIEDLQKYVGMQETAKAAALVASDKAVTAAEQRPPTPPAPKE